MTLAINKQKKLNEAIHLELIFDIRNPIIKELAPAQTASKAVEIETKVGSNPLSIRAGILCNAIVPTAK